VPWRERERVSARATEASSQASSLCEWEREEREGENDHLLPTELDYWRRRVSGTGAWACAEVGLGQNRSGDFMHPSGRPQVGK
jgi:hypothetical protein